MMMNLLVIGLLGGIGYIWASRGFFSALLHLACVLAAGAVAFAAWEPIAELMLDNFTTQWMIDITWGAALLVPFVLLTAIFTSIMNALVRANAVCDGVTNIVGGGVCGAGIAVIASGMLVLSLSMVRSRGDFLDYRAVAFDAQGSVVKEAALWVPVDRITAGLYSHMSTTAMASGEPLAKWRPNLAVDGHLLRVGPDDSILKYTLQAKDFTVAGRYTVGEKQKQPLRTLIGDSKKVLDVEGDDYASINAGVHYIEGFVVQFKAGAREKNGQIVVGPGHVQLVLHAFGAEESLAVQPFAVVSQARGDNIALGRWRFDAKDVFIASAGGAADPVMAFEFLVPVRSDEPWVPIALYVRGVRVDLIDANGQQLKATPYTSVAERDGAIEGQALFAEARQAMSRDGATTYTGNDTVFNTPFAPNHRLPQGIILSKGNIKSIDISEGGAVVGGRSRFRRSELVQRGDDKNLMVEFFDPGQNTVIVQVEVSPTTEFSLLDPASDEATGAPVLIDNLDQRYEAIGFVLQEGDNVEVSFSPGSPITDKNQLPSISRSRTDQKLHLIFRVSLNVSVKAYGIGNKIIKEFNPPRKLDQPQMIRR